MEKPDWYYDDLKQVGTDFADPAEVATYDERQSDDRATVACHLRDEHSTYGWIMEGLIKQAGLDLVSAQYSNGVYADYVAARARNE